MRGVEHYDVCFPFGSKESTIQTPVKQKSTAPIPDLTHHKEASYNSQLKKQYKQKQTQKSGEKQKSTLIIW